MSYLWIHTIDGNIDAATNFLNKHPDRIDELDSERRTPLHHACWRNQSQLVDLFLERGSRAIASQDYYGSMPIHFACQNGNLQIAQRLLAATPPEELAQHLLHLGAGRKLPFTFALESNKIDVSIAIFRAQPEVLFHPSLDFVSGIATRSIAEPIFYAAKELIAPDRLISLIKRNDCQMVLSVIERGNVEFFEELIRFVPTALDEIGADRIMTWLESLIPNLGKIKMTYRLYEYLQQTNNIPPSKFHSILNISIVHHQEPIFDLLSSQPDMSTLSPKDLGLSLFYAMNRRYVGAFDFLLSRGQKEYGFDWVRETLLRTFHHSKKSFSSACLKKCTAGIWDRVVPIYIDLSKDPFYRGQIYARLIGGEETPLHQLLINQSNLDPSMFSLTIWLFNAIDHPSRTHTALEMFDEHGFTPIHYAISRRMVNIAELLVWLGYKLVNTRESTPRTCAQLAGHNFSCRQLIEIVDGTASITNEKIQLKARHRIYFARSLTHRLLHFI